MAIRVSDSVVIARPVDVVFGFVADHENLPAWTVGVKQSQRLTPGPPAAGSTYRVVGELLGRPVESSCQVTAFEPGRGFEGTMTSPMLGLSEQYRFEPDQGGTRVSMKAAVEPRGVFRFLSPIMNAGVRRQVRADHRRLKTVLEHQAPVSEPTA
jgi:uncharacterized membrane protein